MVDPEDEANLTTHARSELVLGGNAATKTIRKLVDERTCLRMLQRTHTTPAINYPTNQASYKYTAQFMEACRTLFESCELNSSRDSISLEELIKITKRLQVEKEKVNAWLQHPRSNELFLTFAEFVDGCFEFYGANLPHLLVHAQTNVFEHPFDLLRAKDREARRFSPYDYVAKQSPIKAQQEHDAKQLLTRSQSEMLKASIPILKTSSSASCLAKNEDQVALKRVKVQNQKDIAIRKKENLHSKISLSQHFGSNIGMIARHIQIGEINEQRVMYA
ncbi:hypothetical protein THRCLA_08615, partial [Thraustotheca clavata]